MSVVGSTLPALNGLTFLKGGPLTIGPPAAGDPIKRAFVLEFWATWCPPCRNSIPHLTELQHKYEKKHVYVVGITNERETQKVQDFVNGMGSQMDYTVVMDTAGAAQQLMVKAQANGIPHAFVVDPSGHITFSGHPMEPAFDSALRAAADQASDKAPAKAPLPLITESYEELMGRSAKELKAMLTDRGLSTADCVEKGDLARKVVEQCSRTTYYK